MSENVTYVLPQVRTQTAGASPSRKLPKSTDTKLLQATLRITVTDQVTSAPLKRAEISVVSLDSWLQGSEANAGSTAGRVSKTDSTGHVRCAVLVGRRCGIFP